MILLTICKQDIFLPDSSAKKLISWSRSHKSYHNCSVEQNTLFSVRCCRNTLLSFVRAFCSSCEFTSMKNRVSTANLVISCTSFPASSVVIVYADFKKAIKIILWSASRRFDIVLKAASSPFSLFFSFPFPFPFLFPFPFPFPFSFPFPFPPITTLPGKPFTVRFSQVSSNNMCS